MKQPVLEAPSVLLAPLSTAGGPLQAAADRVGESRAAGSSGKRFKVFTSCLWNVSAAHEGFSCHTRVSQTIVQFFGHSNFS